MFSISRKAKGIEVAVEYQAPHWLVLIKNSGRKEWEAVRDLTKRIVIQDEFGDNIETRPAIKSFKTVGEAETWIKENMPQAEAKNAQDKSIRNWAKGLTETNQAASAFARQGSAL
jgi:hypothetical protein